jgi:hypothetical protein
MSNNLFMDVSPTDRVFKHLDEELGWDRNELARRLECDAQVVNNWRKRVIPVEKYWDVSKVIGKSVGWIRDGSDNQESRSEIEVLFFALSSHDQEILLALAGFMKEKNKKPTREGTDIRNLSSQTKLSRSKQRDKEPKREEEK